jgi:signal transduction histidine kinase
MAELKAKQIGEEKRRLIGFWNLAKKGLPVILIVLLLAKFILKAPFSNWVFPLVIYLFISVFLLFYVESKRVLDLVMMTNMLVAAVLLYMMMPIIINYLGSVSLLVFITNIFYIGNIFNPSSEKASIFFFLFASSLIAAALIFCEYFGVYPQYQNYVVNNFFLKDFKHLISSLLILLGSFFFFTFHVNNFLNLLRDKVDELNKIRRELFSLNQILEERVRERTKELEEARSVLEIKVQARKEELKKLASNLEKQVKERTRALEKKAEELQEVNRLIVERELKMIKIKEQLRKNKL